MNNKIEFIKKGYWFLPTNEHKVLGSLNFSTENGCSLEIMGSLKPVNFFSLDRVIDIILGETLDGELITLFDCFRLNQSTYPQTGNSSEKYYSNFIIQGKHFISPSEICFDNINCKIPNLINWIDSSGFNDLQFGQYESVFIEYKKPQDIQINVDDKKELLFKFDQYYSWVNNFDRTIKQDVILELRSTQLIHFDDLVKHIYTLSYFLSIAYFRFSQPILFKVNLKASNTNEQQDLLIFFKNTLSDLELSDDFYRMLFTYKSVSINFSLIIQTLFKLEDLLEPIIFIIGNSFKKIPIVPEIYFLTIVQAIETFHRRFIGGRKRPDEEWLKIKNEIQEVLPDEYKTLVSEALQHNNEPNLRTRLKYLLKLIPKNILCLFHLDNKSNCSSFINDIVNLRNYYTHYDPESRPSTNNKELIEFAYKIRGLLIFVILLQLGLNKEDVSEIFLNNKEKFFFIK